VRGGDLDVVARDEAMGALRQNVASVPAAPLLVHLDLGALFEANLFPLHIALELVRGCKRQRERSTASERFFAQRKSVRDATPPWFEALDSPTASQATRFHFLDIGVGGGTQRRLEGDALGRNRPCPSY
jgi:hypothetical protein